MEIEVHFATNIYDKYCGKMYSGVYTMNVIVGVVGTWSSQSPSGFAKSKAPSVRGRLQHVGGSCSKKI